MSFSYSLTFWSILKFYFFQLSSIALSTMSPARTLRTTRNAANKRHEFEDNMSSSITTQKKRRQLPSSSRKVVSKMQKSTSNRSRPITKSRRTAVQAARSGFALLNNKYTYCSCIFSTSKPHCNSSSSSTSSQSSPSSSSHSHSKSSSPIPLPDIPVFLKWNVNNRILSGSKQYVIKLKDKYQGFLFKLHR